MGERNTKSLGPPRLLSPLAIRQVRYAYAQRRWQCPSWNSIMVRVNSNEETNRQLRQYHAWYAAWIDTCHRYERAATKLAKEVYP